MGAIASQITSLTIINSTVYSGTDQRKHQSSASLAFVWWPVNSPHKWPVTRKMFPFDDVIMKISWLEQQRQQLLSFRFQQDANWSIITQNFYAVKKISAKWKYFCFSATAHSSIKCTKFDLLTYHNVCAIFVKVHNGPVLASARISENRIRFSGPFELTQEVSHPVFITLVHLSALAKLYFSIFISGHRKTSYLPVIIIPERAFPQQN